MPWEISQDSQDPENPILDLNFPHDPQFVQNEISTPICWSSIKGVFFNLFKLKNAPVLPESVTGTIYHENIPIQTFWVRLGATALHFASDHSHSTSKTFVNNINFCHITGQIELQWSEHPRDNKVVVNYEYSVSSFVASCK